MIQREGTTVTSVSLSIVNEQHIESVNVMLLERHPATALQKGRKMSIVLKPIVWAIEATVVRNPIPGLSHIFGIVSPISQIQGMHTCIWHEKPTSSPPNNRTKHTNTSP